ncbi:PrgI family protein [Candidatus Wolfebacteria bacterium]|nr:PrgI family protein [Candidatus Wolfebacteria bacterium]
MQFQVPQFIDIEDKIVGPLSLRQFLYLAGAVAISFTSFFIFQLWLWLLISVFAGAFGAALAFVRYNSQPLPRILWLMFFYFWRPRLYLWQREVKEKIIEVKYKEPASRRALFEMSSVKKLWQDLLTTKAPIPKREKSIATVRWRSVPKERFELFRKISGEKEIARRVDYR